MIFITYITYMLHIHKNKSGVNKTCNKTNNYHGYYYCHKENISITPLYGCVFSFLCLHTHMKIVF